MSFEPYDPTIHGVPNDRPSAVHDELFEALKSGPQVASIHRSSLYQAADVRHVRVSYRTLPGGRLLVRLVSEEEPLEQGGANR